MSHFNNYNLHECYITVNRFIQVSTPDAQCFTRVVHLESHFSNWNMHALVLLELYLFHVE